MDPILEQKLAELAHAVEEFVENGKIGKGILEPLLQTPDSLRRAVEQPVIMGWLDKKRGEGRVPVRRFPIRP